MHSRAYRQRHATECLLSQDTTPANTNHSPYRLRRDKCAWEAAASATAPWCISPPAPLTTWLAARRG